MGRWNNKRLSQRYHSKLGSFELVKWDDIDDNIKRKDIDGFSTIWSIIKLRVSRKRKGYGTRLVHKALQRAKDHNIKKLAVIPANSDEARKFWQTFNIYSDGGYIIIIDIIDAKSA